MILRRHIHFCLCFIQDDQISSGRFLCWGKPCGGWLERDSLEHELEDEKGRSLKLLQYQTQLRLLIGVTSVGTQQSYCLLNSSMRRDVDKPVKLRRWNNLSGSSWLLLAVIRGTKQSAFESTFWDWSVSKELADTGAEVGPAVSSVSYQAPSSCSCEWPVSRIWRSGRSCELDGPQMGHV